MSAPSLKGSTYDTHSKTQEKSDNAVNCGLALISGPPFAVQPTLGRVAGRRAPPGTASASAQAPQGSLIRPLPAPAGFRAKNRGRPAGRVRAGCDSDR